MRPRSLVVSAVFHAVAITLLLLAAVLAPPVIAPDRIITIELTPMPLEAPRLALPEREGGGGGQESQQPARKGELPSRAKPKIFIPPQVARVENPQLVVVPALLNAPAVDVQFASVGDPLGLGSRGLGDGKSFFGIGDGDGPGSGEGKNGIGEGNAYLGRLTRTPQLIYKEEPEYSEEARKARLMGKVILLIDVGVDGRPANIRVVQSLGLGLDEAAVKAIQRWRFRPAMAGDKPVVAPAKVEVGFQML